MRRHLEVKQDHIRSLVASVSHLQTGTAWCVDFRDADDLAPCGVTRVPAEWWLPSTWCRALGSPSPHRGIGCMSVNSSYVSVTTNVTRLLPDTTCPVCWAFAFVDLLSPPASLLAPRPAHLSCNSTCPPSSVCTPAILRLSFLEQSTEENKWP